MLPITRLCSWLTGQKRASQSSITYGEMTWTIFTSSSLEFLLAMLTFWITFVFLEAKLKNDMEMMTHRIVARFNDFRFVFDTGAAIVHGNSTFERKRLRRSL